MKPHDNATTRHRKEQGNVLFLILIAVALFAALSYAVTQSTRSGGGDASKEKSLVSSAALTQYPASLKTAIVRMTVSNGVAVSDLLFDKPPYTNLTTDDLKKRGVFYPDIGGGATYTDAPSDVIAENPPGDWVFNANNEVANIGTTATGAAATAPTADVIAFLQGISQAVCEKIHEQLGMGKALTDFPIIAIDTGSMAQATPGILAATGRKITGGAVDGQPQGCIRTSASSFTYYHVLVER